MIERIQAIDLLWDRTGNAVKRYQYALKVVESGEKAPIGNRTDRSSSKLGRTVSTDSLPLGHSTSSQANLFVLGQGSALGL
jgi:hypothetical protein